MHPRAGCVSAAPDPVRQVGMQEITQLGVLGRHALRYSEGRATRTAWFILRSYLDSSGRSGSNPGVLDWQPWRTASPIRFVRSIARLPVDLHEFVFAPGKGVK